MSDKLKPCPFCGHDWPLLSRHSNSAYTEFSVRCYNGCCGRGDESRDEAVRLWNTRAPTGDA